MQKRMQRHRSKLSGLQKRQMQKNGGMRTRRPRTQPHKKQQTSALRKGRIVFAKRPRARSGWRGRPGTTRRITTKSAAMKRLVRLKNKPSCGRTMKGHRSTCAQ